MVFVQQLESDDTVKYFYKTLYGKRFPTSFLYKKAARDDTGIKALQDPITPQIKILCEEAWRGDPVVRISTNKIAQFILGKRTKTVLEATKQLIKEKFNSDAIKTIQDAEKAAIDEVMTDKEANSIKLDIDTIDEEVGLRAKLEAALIQKTVGGRAAIFIEKVENGIPADLKLLSWQRLGQVDINTDSWRIETIQYEDESLFEPGTPADERKLNAEDLLYFTNVDFNITPNSIHYGYPGVEPVAMISEANRIIDEIDVKEMVRTSYTGFGLLQIDSKNDAEIRKFLKEYKAGKWMATNLKVNPMVNQLMSNAQFIIDVRQANDARILGAIEIPSFLLAGFENITNRATAYGVMYAWSESVLSQKRTELRDQLEPQWYRSIADIMLRNQGVDPTIARYRIRMAFDDITFETLGDKATTLLPLYQAGVIPITKLLDLLDMPELKEEMEAKIEEQNKLREQIQRDMAKQPRVNVGGNGKVNPNEPNVKPSRNMGLDRAADILTAAYTKSEFDLLQRQAEEKRTQEIHEQNMKVLKNRAEFLKIIIKEAKAGNIDIKEIRKDLTEQNAKM